VEEGAPFADTTTLPITILPGLAPLMSRSSQYAPPASAASQSRNGMKFSTTRNSAGMMSMRKARMRLPFSSA
jgi:hypothetical protein